MEEKIKLVKLPSFDVKIPIIEEDVPLLFPSVGEYPVYDNNSYKFMQADKQIEAVYKKAIFNNCLNKDVIDIGTGEFADWAAYAMDYGAKSSTGIEMIEESYKKAKKNIKKYGYEKDIQLIHNNSLEWIPDKKYDVCVSEIIGTIGSSEGVINVLEDAKNRFMKEDHIMIPNRCTTRAALVNINEYIPKLAFHPDSINYIDQIFKFNNKPFDLRLSITPAEDKNYNINLLSNKVIIEDLNFNSNHFYPSNLRFRTKKGEATGLIIWIELEVEAGDLIISSLYDKTRWEINYVPFKHNIILDENKILDFKLSRSIDIDNIHPNYIFEIEDQKIELLYKHNKFKQGIYKQLFI